MYARQIVPVGLALWLMLGAVSAQQQSAGIFMGQVARSRKADLEAQSRVNEALEAFDELLAVTKSAAVRNSHWRVRLESWGNALEAWRKASAALPTPVRRLKRCAIPLEQAEGPLKRAERCYLAGRKAT